MTTWTFANFRAREASGLIPLWLSELDPRPAREQLHEHYQHDGGWRPMEGWTSGPSYSIKYPGDPTYKPLGQCQFRTEVVCVYADAWVAIFQPDGTFEVARMD